jgi:hypothetical protein
MDWLGPAAGGVLIGLAAGVLMLGAGRVAGVSGLLASALGGERDAWAFLLALPVGAAVAVWLLGGPPVAMGAGPGRLVLAGLLVGLGARLANGCTSGHGVCGSARLSPRSVAATVVFMAVGMATAFLLPGAP